MMQAITATPSTGGIMSLGIPVVFALALLVIEAVLFGALGLGTVLVGFNQPLVQLKCKLLRQDTIIDVAGNEMWLEAGKKEFKSDIVYKKETAGLAGSKKGLTSHIDPTRYDDNSLLKWGKSRVLAYYIAKSWPKMLSGMAATKRVLQVSSIHISKDGKIKTELMSVRGVKINKNTRLKPILDRLGMTPVYYNADPESTLKYNEYLCLIAESNKDNALKLIYMYADLSSPNKDDREEAEKQLKATAQEFIVVPEGVDRKSLDDKAMTSIRDQLIEEIRMVREFCKDLLVPPTVVALGEFMRAYPDRNTVDLILNDIQNTAEQKANAQVPKSLDIKWVVLGLLGEAGLFIGLIVILFSIVH